ncbi:hypothetical protein P3X46_023931 [Hevea brasiliensis]|uniref:Transmembrane protein n=1 Tax=Hevea brasiliensis TaxID=3981 RepID=A0ABQ9LEH6_HEVBR|nr:uncharacterized protein LOC110633803 [Hevea brasiliensis]KAJ9164341.1 hypothetical protein P3X46_023931 [Hevea brasiliensis]
MLSLYSFSLCNKQPFSLPQLSLISNNKPIPLISLRLLNGYTYFFKKTSTNQSSSSSCIVHAAEKDSQQFEIDPDRAREALQKLDQQLQDLSKKQVNPPKIKASEVKIARDQTTEEEPVPQLSGSFLALLTTALFLFTIFYNILYITVIEPSTDGAEPTPTTDLETKSPELALLQLLPLAPEIFL